MTTEAVLQPLSPEPGKSALAQAGDAPTTATVLEVREDMGMVDPESLTPDSVGEVSPELEAAADQWTQNLLDVAAGDFQGKAQRTQAVESMGAPVSQKAARMNEILNRPIRDLAKAGEDGGEIANSLVELKAQFDLIDPTGLTFSAGWPGRFASALFGWIPVIGPKIAIPLNKFFTRFEASGTVIEALFQSLESSGQQLLRDNEVLRDEQVFMREVTHELQRVILAGRLVDARLAAAAEKLGQDDDRRKFIEEELIFPLRQRITDLQQQLVVLQQGIITYEVLRRNNKELVRGVRRSRTVTYTALQIGITAALALVQQKIVIGKLKALDAMGMRIITSNAKLLRGQGVEIHKDAASARLDDTGLANATREAIAALDEIATFRRQAIGQMGQLIAERDHLIQVGEEAIVRMEKGNAAGPELIEGLDWDDAVARSAGPVVSS